MPYLWFVVEVFYGRACKKTITSTLFISAIQIVTTLTCQKKKSPTLTAVRSVTPRQHGIELR